MTATGEVLWLVLLPLVFLFLVLSLLKTSLRTLTRVAVRRLAEESPPRARALLGEFLLSPTEFILHLQSLIQVALIAIAVLVTCAVLGWPLDVRSAVAFVVLAGLTLVFEHFFPRFVLSVDRVRLLARLLPAYGLVAPLARAIAWPVSSLYRTLFRARPGASSNGEVSEEEIRAFIDVGEEAGILDEAESKIVESVVDLSETMVREVMTPRVDVISIEASRTVAELRDLMLRSMHSRVPVYRDRVDNIEGVVYIKDVLAAWRDGGEGQKVQAWMKPTLFVPETKKVSSLLKEFQRGRQTFAIVVDEFGGTSGLVTVEDLLEEIVGEIREPYEQAPVEARQQDDGSWLLAGKASVDKLDELFGLVVDEADFDTVAGLVFSTLGRVPAKGEEFLRQGLRFRVVDADRHRVNLVQVWRLEPAPAGGLAG